MNYLACLQLFSSSPPYSTSRHILLLDDDVSALGNALHRISLLLGYKLIWKKDWAVAKLHYPGEVCNSVVAPNQS